MNGQTSGPDRFLGMSPETKAAIVAEMRAAYTADPYQRGRIDGMSAVVGDVVRHSRIVLFGDVVVPVTIHWPDDGGELKARAHSGAAAAVNAKTANRCPWAIHFAALFHTRCDKTYDHDGRHAGPGLEQFPGQVLEWFPSDLRGYLTTRDDDHAWELPLESCPALPTCPSHQP